MFLDVLTDRAASDYCAAPTRTLIRCKSRNYPVEHAKKKIYISLPLSFSSAQYCSRFAVDTRPAKHANESGITRDIISELIAAQDLATFTAIAFSRANGMTDTVESSKGFAHPLPSL